MSSTAAVSAKSYKILGTEIDAFDLEGGLARANELLAEGGAHYVVLPYVEFIMRARSDQTVLSALNQADLALSNGVALNWAAQYLYGGPAGLGRLVSTLGQIIFNPKAVHMVLPSRFDSANFTWQLLKQAAASHQSVFLIGSPKRQSIEAAAAYIARAIPGLKIAGCFTGYLDAEKERRLILRLKQAKPDLILVGTGFPRQELLMQRLKSQLGHGLMLGEGGSFDYEQYGGHIRRAPTWMRQSGLEWLWRLMLEPGRIRRQLVIPAFIWQIYRAGQKAKND